MAFSFAPVAARLGQLSISSNSQKRDLSFFKAVGGASGSTFFAGEASLSAGAKASVTFHVGGAAASNVVAGGLDLGSLSPAKGSNRAAKRKGRGISAGQGATCGFGMRGQKSRSGRSTRPGFEGGQNPLYRRVPKLKGIAGGMSAGVKEHNELNVGDLSVLAPNTVVDMESLDQTLWKDLRSKVDSEKKLLKILGDGEIKVPITVRAEAVSESARAKIEAAGGKVEIVPVKAKWVRDRSVPTKKQLNAAKNA
eukprot:tig00020934_g16108.t1